nr:hypothetical protein [Tanacetum cinerariifolium]
MSAMANITTIVTTVTKTATKEKTLNGAETASKINILDFCEEHYEDILPVMDKILRDKQREVHTRLEFGEESRKSQRMREDSQNSTAKTLSARYLEVVLTNGTLFLAEIILEAKTAPTALKNRTVIPTPLTEHGTNIGMARVWFDELPSVSIDGYKDLKAPFLAYFMQQKMYVKDPVKIHNIKQKDGETSEISWRNSRMKMDGETTAASKKKAHTPWKLEDQSKLQNFERRSDFKNQPKDGWGSNKFTPLTRMAKEIFPAKSGKFKPPPTMVTLVEKRSSNKFCEFYNDKGHSADECVQLRKQIEEFVRACKLSYFIKEIRRDKDQQKTRKRDAPIKDKVTAIYMIQPWQRVTRQKIEKIGAGPGACQGNPSIGTKAGRGRDSTRSILPQLVIQPGHDFLVEKPDDAPPDTSIIETPQEPWTLFTDGSSCVDGSSERIPRKRQNRIKTRQKREAWRSREKSEVVTVDRRRKTKENAKRRAGNANTFKLYRKKEDRGAVFAI